MREQAADAGPSQRMGAILPAVELYESTNREAGWDCDLTQMSTGPLEARFFYTSSDEINFVTESFNQQLHLRYAPPPGMVSFAIPVATEGYSRLFGHQLNPDDLITFGVEAELDFLSAHRTDSLALFMPEKRFQELTERLQPAGSKILQRGKGSVKQCAKGALASLWREANEMLSGNASAAVEAELLPNLAAALVLLATDNQGRFSTRYRLIFAESPHETLACKSEAGGDSANLFIPSVQCH